MEFRDDYEKGILVPQRMQNCRLSVTEFDLNSREDFDDHLDVTDDKLLIIDSECLVENPDDPTAYNFTGAFRFEEEEDHHHHSHQQQEEQEDCDEVISDCQKDLRRDLVSSRKEEELRRRSHYQVFSSFFATRQL